jgi:hypothetical protein
MSVGLFNHPIKQLIATQGDWFAAGEDTSLEQAAA